MRLPRIAAALPLLVAVLTSPLAAQVCQTGYSNVVGSKIENLNNQLLPSGTFVISGVDATHQPLNVGAPGGGVITKSSVKAVVANGAIVGTVCVPRSDTSTQYIRYHFRVLDNSATGTQAVVVDANDVPITTDTFSLDTYAYPANAYATTTNVFTGGNVNGDLHVTGTVYAATLGATTAQTAVHAQTADQATAATTAQNATAAQTAVHAQTADQATTAQSATAAQTALAFAATPTPCPTNTPLAGGVDVHGNGINCGTSSSTPAAGNPGDVQLFSPGSTFTNGPHPLNVDPSTGVVTTPAPAMGVATTTPFLYNGVNATGNTVFHIGQAGSTNPSPGISVFVLDGNNGWDVGYINSLPTVPANARVFRTVTDATGDVTFGFDSVAYPGIRPMLKFRASDATLNESTNGFANSELQGGLSNTINSGAQNIVVPATSTDSTNVYAGIGVFPAARVVDYRNGRDAEYFYMTDPAQPAILRNGLFDGDAHNGGLVNFNPVNFGCAGTGLNIGNQNIGSGGAAVQGSSYCGLENILQQEWVRGISQLRAINHYKHAAGDMAVNTYNYWSCWGGWYDASGEGCEVDTSIGGQQTYIWQATLASSTAGTTGLSQVVANCQYGCGQYQGPADDGDLVDVSQTIGTGGFHIDGQVDGSGYTATTLHSDDTTFPTPTAHATLSADLNPATSLADTTVTATIVSGAFSTTTATTGICGHGFESFFIDAGSIAISGPTITFTAPIRYPHPSASCDFYQGAFGNFHWKADEYVPRGETQPVWAGYKAQATGPHDLVVPVYAGGGQGAMPVGLHNSGISVVIQQISRNGTTGTACSEIGNEQPKNEQFIGQPITITGASPSSFNISASTVSLDGSDDCFTWADSGAAGTSTGNATISTGGNIGNRGLFEFHPEAVISQIFPIEFAGTGPAGKNQKALFFPSSNGKLNLDANTLAPGSGDVFVNPLPASYIVQDRAATVNATAPANADYHGDRHTFNGMGWAGANSPVPVNGSAIQWTMSNPCSWYLGCGGLLFPMDLITFIGTTDGGSAVYNDFFAAPAPMDFGSGFHWSASPKGLNQHCVVTDAVQAGDFKFCVDAPNNKVTMSLGPTIVWQGTLNGGYTPTMSADTVQAGSITEPLSTPASSSDPCNPGQFKDDANFHYVCTSPNNWKRVALTSF